MRLRNLTVLLIILFCQKYCVSNTTDSLFLSLEKAKNITEIIDKLHKLEENTQKNPQNLIPLLEKLKSSHFAKNNTIKSYITFIQAKAYRENGQYQKALGNLEVLEKTQSLNSDMPAKIQIEKGKILYRKGNYKNSYQCYLNALMCAKNKNKLLIESYSGLGKVGFSSGKYIESLNYYEKALYLADSIGNFAIKSELYNSIAAVHVSQKNYLKSILFLNKAKEINQKLNNKKRIAVNLGNIAMIYTELDSLEKAKEIYYQALQIDKKINNKVGQAFKLANLGSVFFKKRQLDKALELSYQAYQIFSEKDIKRGLAFAANNIGHFYTCKRNYTKAKEYLTLSEKYSEEIRNFNLIAENKKTFSVFYFNQNNFKEAYKYSQEHSSWKDSIYFEEKNKIAAEMEARYDLTQKENEIVLMNKEMEILNSQEKLSKLKIHTLIIGLFLFFILGVIIYLRMTQKNAQETALLQKSKEIEKAKNELMKTRLKNSILAKQQLLDELKYKNQELTNLALLIVQKNEFMADLKKNLKDFFPTMKSHENHQAINQLLIKINQNLNNSKNMELFSKKIEQEHHAFFALLDKHFSDLTKNEKRLCALLRINLSSKEIASLNNSNYKAIEMARYRLRKKLNLSKEINLTDFLNSLH
ncbi:MAG: tetratricopeptide repeat protein [Bacteroidales bacterium]